MVLVLLTIACGSAEKVGGTGERFNIRNRQLYREIMHSLHVKQGESTARCGDF